MNKIKKIINKLFKLNYLKTILQYKIDAFRFVSNSGTYKPHSKYAIEANITIHYHVLEKGLTMPNRHLPFGIKVASELIDLINEYESQFEISSQVRHAIAVLKEYFDLHIKMNAFTSSNSFWNKICTFDKSHSEIKMSHQKHFIRKDFYSAKYETFEKFATSRHSVRNYSSLPVDIEKIKHAIQIATLSPSACNRQHVRARCICDKILCGEVLALQGGNRGFGYLADKVLIITSDLSAEIGGIRERNDPYVNGGIFLMNLSYALHYYEVAHCILTCSFEADIEKKLRRICKIPDNEVLIALMSCGEAPEEFDVAISPKRDISEVFSIIE